MSGKESIEALAENIATAWDRSGSLPFCTCTTRGTTPTSSGSPLLFEVGRYTASVAGGFNWLIPAGSKFYVVGETLPSYVSYQDLPERSFFGGNFQAFLLGFFNRATLKVRGFNSKGLAYIDSQTTAPVIETMLDGSSQDGRPVRLELFLLRRRGDHSTAVRKRGFADSARGHERTPALEGAVGAGIRYRFSPELNVALGYEKTITEFVFFPELQRQPEHDAYLISVRYDRPRFYLTLVGGLPAGQPLQRFELHEYNTPTGGYFASYYLTRNVELQAYGDRRETYGLLVPAFLATRYGGAINFKVHRDVQLRALGVWGTNIYGSSTAGDTQSPGHTDKTLDYGGGVTSTIFRKIVWTVTATESQFNSPLPGLDRKALRVLTSFSFDEWFYR